jgi:hypothetical protein
MTKYPYYEQNVLFFAVFLMAFYFHTNTFFSANDRRNEDVRNQDK